MLLDPTLDYTESNGDYVKHARKSKGLLAAQFYAAVAKGDFDPKNLSPETLVNVYAVLRSITDALKAQKTRRG